MWIFLAAATTAGSRSSTRCSYADDEAQPSHVSVCEPGEQRPRRDRRSRVDHPLRQQGVSLRAREAARSRDSADDGRQQRAHRRDHPRAPAAVRAEAAGQRVLRGRVPRRYARGAVRGAPAPLVAQRPRDRAVLHADGVRLARRRARPPAAVRLPLLHGRRPLADPQSRRAAHGKEAETIACNTPAPCSSSLRTPTRRRRLTASTSRP